MPEQTFVGFWGIKINSLKLFIKVDFFFAKVKNTFMSVSHISGAMPFDLQRPRADSAAWSWAQILMCIAANYLETVSN